MNVEGVIYTDKELLDFLQFELDKKRYTGKCVFRFSTTGRGIRLLETSSTKGSIFDIDAVSSIRLAICEGIERTKENED